MHKFSPYASNCLQKCRHCCAKTVFRPDFHAHSMFTSIILCLFVMIGRASPAAHPDGNARDLGRALGSGAECRCRARTAGNAAHFGRLALNLDEVSVLPKPNHFRQAFGTVACGSSACRPLSLPHYAKRTGRHLPSVTCNRTAVRFRRSPRGQGSPEPRPSIAEALRCPQSVSGLPGDRCAALPKADAGWRPCSRHVRYAPPWTRDRMPRGKVRSIASVR